MNMSQGLEGRVKMLEDIQEIRRLKSLYCRICDTGYDKPLPERKRLKDIFTEDGIWDTGFYVIKVGEQDPPAGSDWPFGMGVHYSINGAIEVTGDSARGYWHGLIPLTTPDGEAEWCAGIYEEDYQRTPTGWKYKKLKFHPAFMSPHGKGWAEKATLTHQEKARHALWSEA